ncbi:MAG: hypothetical protein U0746_16955 [Gemmataceae bacterium]
MLLTNMRPLLIAATALAVSTAGRADAGLILGTTANGSVTGSLISFTSGTAVLADPGREFAGPLANVSPISQSNVFAFGDLTATTIRVGFEMVPGLFSGVSSANSNAYTFSFTGLALAPGEQIIGLSVLTNSRNTSAPITLPNVSSGGASFVTTANSITITLTGFAVGGTATNGDTDDSITYTILTQTVPEPATAVSACVGIVLLAGRTLRARRRCP